MSNDSPDEKKPDAAPDFRAADYWEERLSAEFSLQGVGDIGLPLSYNRWLYRVRASAFRHMLRCLKGAPERGTVLDVGSGTGFYIDQWLSRKPASLTGSDITETVVRNLSAQFPAASFVRCDIGGDLPASLEPASFDAISAYDVLFHIVDSDAYARAIRNFADLLKPGGYLIFSDNLVNSDQSHDKHQISRRESDVRDLLASNGLKVEKVFPMFIFMNDPVRSRSRVMRALFSRIYRIAARGEGWGQVAGTMLYPIEVMALRLMSRGPSTEILICRRQDCGGTGQ